MVAKPTMKPGEGGCTKYYSNDKLPRQTIKGSFCWRYNLKLLNMYKGISQAEAGLGETIFLWKDMWNEKLLHTLYPQLHYESRSIAIHFLVATI
jgi:hypothetical protein